ncbi:enoyl-CoA hydratase/isomerase family protein [Bacillus megaterium]|nr:enoyl-CoA hydratase/isomerase family protein [Priestia megaterium]
MHAPHNLNAINQELYEELKQSLEEISQDKAIGALILNSDVSNAFSAGVDLQFIQNLSNEEASDFFTNLSKLLDTLIHFPVPRFLSSIDMPSEQELIWLFHAMYALPVNQHTFDFRSAVWLGFRDTAVG